MAIEVSLNTNNTPPVTVNPTTHNVNSGNQTINWKRASGQPAFTFVGVTWWNASNPFSAPTFNQDSSEMSVTEDNNSSGTSYSYTITVAFGGNEYKSLPQPVGRRLGNGGTPTIHNN